MNIIDTLLDLGSKPICYEDQYMKVTKVLAEIPNSGKNYIKRVQLVVWKSKDTSIPDLDIRTFVKKSGNYHKGITFSINEARELYHVLKGFFDQYDK